ncbi:hypothetical protein F4776DRAFT_652183 [Hypoxylon sp. NC0597]|nr:hypothetical protein F4776DRAFT_652183 [Hypoxylon sp. NC0597]
MSSSSPTMPSCDSPAIMPSKSHSANPSKQSITASSTHSQESVGDRVKKRKRNLKNDSAEDLEQPKKRRSTSKDVEPKLGTAKVRRRKGLQAAESTDDPQKAKESKSTNNSLELESQIAKDKKRKRIPGGDFADTLQPAKKARPTLEELECELKAAKGELEATKGELEATKSELKTTKSFLEMAEYQLERAEIKFEIMDNELMCQFTQLSFYIHMLVRDCLVNRSEGETIPQHVEKALNEVSDIPIRKFLAVESHADLFFEAFIWRFLCIEYLDNPFKLWGETDELGRVLASIHLGELGGNEDRLNQWRAFTGQILYDCPIDDAKLRRAKERLLQLVKPFILIEKRDKIETDVQPKIDQIFKTTVLLARHLNRYMLRFEIQRKGPLDTRDVSLVFDEAWMQIHAGGLDNDNAVHLVVSPALMMRGKRPGDDVEQTAARQKAQVCYKTGPWYTDSDEYRRMKAGDHTKAL